MYLKHNQSDFATFASFASGCSAPASAALTSELVHQLLSSAATPREQLVSALQESLRQFESLLSCVSGTFYRCELTAPWQTEFISPGIEAITGYDPGFFARTPYADIVVAEDMGPLQDVVDRAVERKEHFTARYRIRHRSGEIRWVAEHGRAVYDADGSPQFLEGFISDVTEMKNLELETDRIRNEIVRLNDRLSAILEAIPDGIMTVDANWVYTYANGNALRELGREEGLVGKNSLEVFSSITQAPAWPAVESAAKERTPAHTEYFNPDLQKWYELFVVPDGDGITTFFRNITDRKELEATLVNQVNDLRTTLDSIPFMAWSALSDGVPDYFNQNWFEFTGLSADGAKYDPEEFNTSLFHPDDLHNVIRHWQRSVETGEDYEVEYRLRHRSGEYRWLLGRARALRDGDGKILRWYGTCTDIHERVLTEHRLRESLTVQANILDATTDCIKIMDVEGRLIEMNNPGLRAMAIADRGMVIGKPWPEFWPEKGKLAARNAVQKARKGKVARFTGFCPTTTGEPKWWDVVVTPMRDADGAINHLLCVSRDITGQRATAERLRIASEQDALTGLPNRRAFEKTLKRVTAAALRSGASVGLMLIDLDHFKHVNDTLGHLAGDHLLRVLANRLKACVTDTCFVARLGGDEFAVVIEGIREEKELLAAAGLVLSRMEAPVTFAGKLINGGLSIGCALFPRDAADGRGLFKHADTALYDLKAAGRGGIQMFSSQMTEAAERTASQLNLARRVIHEDAVEPYYQPKVRLATGEVVGLEALLRWWSPKKGIQPPSSVAEAFNDYELAAKIGTLMQRRVFGDMVEWLSAGLEPPVVSINAAPAEFLRDDFGERLLERLMEHGVPPALVEVEITEHVFQERRFEYVIRALQLLKRSGVRIALDDFGTGHSSLSHLRDFPVDVLKLDRSFISRMLDEPAMLAIVRAMAELGPSLAIDIVAEGVESLEQLRVLRDAGCGFGQGYLFGKAMDANEVARRLVAGNWPFAALHAA